MPNMQSLNSRRRLCKNGCLLLLMVRPYDNHKAAFISIQLSSFDFAKLAILEAKSVLQYSHHPYARVCSILKKLFDFTDLHIADL